jgi:putative tricarboxylic transport membrane protein
MKINDALSGILVGALGAAIFLNARTFPSVPGQDIGPNVFPQLIAAGFMICAAMLIWRGLKTVHADGWIAVPEGLRKGRIALGFVLIPVALLFYLFASEKLGFFPVSIIMLLALFLVFKVRLWTAVIVAVAGTFAIHFLFYKLLKVPLPWGILQSVAW